jgi:lysozyme
MPSWKGAGRVAGKTAAGIGGVGLLAGGVVGRQLGLGPAMVAAAAVGAAFLGGYKFMGGKGKAGGKGDDAVIPETNMTEGSFNALNQIYKDTFAIRNWLESSRVVESQKKELAVLEDKRWDDILAALRSEGLFVTPGEDGDDKDGKSKGGFMSWLGKFYAFKTLLGFLKKFLKFLRIGKLLTFLRIGALILSRFLWPVALLAAAIWIIPKIFNNLDVIKKFIMDTMNNIWSFIKDAFAKMRNFFSNVWDKSTDWVKDMLGFGDGDVEEPIPADTGMDDTIGETDVGRASSDYMIEGQLNLMERGLPGSGVIPTSDPTFASEFSTEAESLNFQGDAQDAARAAFDSKAQVLPATKPTATSTTAQEVFVGAGAGTVQAVKAVAEGSAGTGITPSLLKFLKEQEGFGDEGKAYKDTAGVWTIGYGHTGGVKEGDVITKKAAEKLLAKDIKAHEIRAEKHVGKDTWAGLSQGQRDMLTEMEFNVGLSKFPTFTGAVLENDWQTASQEYKRHYKEAGTGDKIPLTRRNKAFFKEWIEPMLMPQTAGLSIPGLMEEIIIEENYVDNSTGSTTVHVQEIGSPEIAHGSSNPWTPAQPAIALS